jgi:hypothetical protein
VSQARDGLVVYHLRQAVAAGDLHSQAFISAWEGIGDAGKQLRLVVSGGERAATAAWTYWAAAVTAVHGAAALPDAGRLDGLGDVRVAALGALGAQGRASAADQTVLCEGDARDYSARRAAELQRVAPGSAICTPLGAGLRSTSQLLQITLSFARLEKTYV